MVTTAFKGRVYFWLGTLRHPFSRKYLGGFRFDSDRGTFESFSFLVCDCGQGYKTDSSPECPFPKTLFHTEGPYAHKIKCSWIPKHKIFYWFSRCEFRGESSSCSYQCLEENILSVFVCVCDMCASVCVCVQVHMYMHIHVCGVPRFVSGVFLDHFPPYILRDGLSLNREDTILVSLQPACSGDPLSPLHQGYRWATTPKRLLSGF